MFGMMTPVIAILMLALEVMSRVLVEKRSSRTRDEGEGDYECEEGEDEVCGSAVNRWSFGLYVRF